MKNQISRRDLIKSTLVASGAAASTGCGPGPSPGTPGSLPEYTVTLLCSGMIAIYWTEADKRLEILIPMPTHMGQIAHLVRFGGVGGDPLGAGQYRLDLPGFKETTDDPHCSLDSAREIAMGKYNQASAPLALNNGGIFARIVIPKPTSVQLLRPIVKKDSHKNFFEGDAADNNFKIRPTTLPAIYAMTYKKVTGLTGLFPIHGTNVDPVTFPNGTLNLTVHLYSERSVDVCAGDHIELFNAMFARSDNGKMLNLSHEPGNTTDGCLTVIDPAGLPENLSVLDLKTLAELGVKSGSGSACPIPTYAECIAGRNDAGLLVADPAGCSNARIYG